MAIFIIFEKSFHSAVFRQRFRGNNGGFRVYSFLSCHITCSMNVILYFVVCFSPVMDLA